MLGPTRVVTDKPPRRSRKAPPKGGTGGGGAPDIMTTLLPNPAIMDVLLPAYAPCPHFRSRGGSCREAVWSPEQGLVPRGFLGATGELHEVRLVMVFAEPGHPYAETPFNPAALAPETLMRAAIERSYHHKSQGRDLFHRNVRQVLGPRLSPSII